MITVQQAREARDTYLKSVAGGVFFAEIDTYSLQDGGEIAVLNDVTKALKEFYELMISKVIMYSYHMHHCLRMAFDELERNVPDIVVVMFDGTCALGIPGSKHMALGALGWSGFRQGYKCSTQTSLTWCLSNRSEDAEGTKHVIQEQINKIRNIKNFKKQWIKDSDGRYHGIDYSNVTPRIVMDGKAMRSFLHYKGASICPSSPHVSKLVKCDFKSSDRAYQYMEYFSFCGYHQCSIFKEDLPTLTTFHFIQADISRDQNALRKYLKEIDDDLPILTATIPFLVRKKTDCLKSEYNILPEEEKEKLDADKAGKRKWFLDTAKYVFEIEFIDCGHDDDIPDAMPGPLHLYARTYDKVMQYFTVNRRVFDRDEFPEIDVMKSCEALKLLAQRLEKLMKKESKKTSIKINCDGNRIKQLIPLFAKMVIRGLKILRAEHEHEDMVKMNTLINLQFLHYIEVSFGWITSVMNHLGDKYDYDEAKDAIYEVIKAGIETFHWFRSKCRWITTPTTWDVFISLGFSVDTLLHRNKEQNVKCCYKDVLDQQMENNVKVAKDMFRRHNAKRKGQCKFIADYINFPVIGKMDQDMFVMRYDSGSHRKNQKQNTWFGGAYDISLMTQDEQKMMTALRKHEYEADENIKGLYENDRIKDLERYIQEHDAAEAVGLHDSDDENDKENDPSIAEISGLVNSNRKNNSNSANKNKKMGPSLAKMAGIDGSKKKNGSKSANTNLSGHKRLRPQPPNKKGKKPELNDVQAHKRKKLNNRLL